VADASWRALHFALVALTLLSGDPDDEAIAERARKVIARLFGEKGLSFTQIGYTSQWAHADRLLAAIDAAPKAGEEGPLSGAIASRSREEEGTQSPLQTLDMASGTCRDFATLFVEAVRSLGFGARVVSGYLFDPERNRLGSEGAGSTHAWAEVYVPGAGWITLDPTNRSIGGFNLIPVAVARDIRNAMPVAGSFAGPADALLEMSVNVLVTEGRGTADGCIGRDS
jgi:hypothetical protein